MIFSESLKLPYSFNMTTLSSEKFEGYIGHVVCSMNYLTNDILPYFKNKTSKAQISSIILCSINDDKKKAIDGALILLVMIIQLKLTRRQKRKEIPKISCFFPT